VLLSGLNVRVARWPVFTAAWNAAVSVVLAPCCACCDAPLDDPASGAVCARCWSAVPVTSGPLCRTCGDAVSSWRGELCARCGRTPRIITIGRAIGPYDGSLREILHTLKYDKRRSVAAPLARRMVLAGADVLNGADLAVPVPLHFSRLYSRGFNQAAEVARHIGIPVVYALRRRRATVTQTDLPEPQRFDNVREAFALRRRASVAGKVVVVVDDVSTTGATLDACARVLLAAGATEVRGLTAARAASRLLS
jgi:ComF family protein